jgi:hypothetical protein
MHPGGPSLRVHSILSFSLIWRDVLVIKSPLRLSHCLRAQSDVLSIAEMKVIIINNEFLKAITKDLEAGLPHM